MDRPIVEALHADQVLEHGGSLGIRDEGLLESALARPQQKWHYEPGTDLATLAAAYAFGIAKNHPFIDGNKRGAHAAMEVFLMLNGLELTGTVDEHETLMLDLADGRISREQLATWLEQRTKPIDR